MRNFVINFLKFALKKSPLASIWRFLRPCCSKFSSKQLQGYVPILISEEKRTQILKNNLSRCIYNRYLLSMLLFLPNRTEINHLMILLSLCAFENLVLPVYESLRQLFVLHQQNICTFFLFNNSCFSALRQWNLSCLCHLCQHQHFLRKAVTVICLQVRVDHIDPTNLYMTVQLNLWVVKTFQMELKLMSFLHRMEFLLESTFLGNWNLQYYFFQIPWQSFKKKSERF